MRQRDQLLIDNKTITVEALNDFLSI